METEVDIPKLVELIKTKPDFYKCIACAMFQKGYCDITVGDRHLAKIYILDALYSKRPSTSNGLIVGGR